MYCDFCGSELPDDSVYCAFCGKKLSGDTASYSEPHIDYSGGSRRTGYEKPQPVHKSGSDKFEIIFLLGLCALVMIIAIPLMKSSSGSTVTSTPVVTSKVTSTKNEKISNGEVLYNRYGDLSVSLTIQNKTTQDCCVRLTGSGVVAQLLYIKAGSSAVFDSPMGTYTVQIATGPVWQGTETWFGAATKFYTMDEKAVFSWNTEQTLTIPKSLSGFTIDTVDWDD